MKLTAKKYVLALAAATCLVALGTNVSATTLTFADAGPSNSDVPPNYGSNISTDSAAYVTTDGTGATPGIGLTWAPTGGDETFSLMLPNANIIEFHSASTFAGAGLDVPIVQFDVDMSGHTEPPADPTIDFSVPADSQLVIHGLDFGNATDQAPNTDYSWTVNVIKLSDMSVVSSTSTGLLGPGSFEHMTINFTGEVGESYQLHFDDGGADQVRTGIDNLSFSQIVVPEPAGMILLVLGALSISIIRRR